MNEQPGIQIIISTGPEDTRRATLGFAAAAAAGACGVAVAVFLVLDGAQWALQSEAGAEVCAAGFQPISELFEAILAAGGRIDVCPTCLDGACGIPSQGRADSMLRRGESILQA
jgi:predicted peroxiredoxin